MKKVLLIVLIAFLVSCKSEVYVVSDFNAVGKIVKKKKCRHMEEGTAFKYLIEFDPDTKCWIVYEQEFSKNDLVYVKSNTQMTIEEGIESNKQDILEEQFGKE